MLGPEAERGGGGQQDEVAAEAEEDGPHPEGEGRLLAELREVEGGEEDWDEAGDHDHAVPVAKHVTEVTPEHSTSRVEYCREGSDHGQEVVVLDEGLAESFVEPGDRLADQHHTEPGWQSKLNKLRYQVRM